MSEQSNIGCLASVIGIVIIMGLVFMMGRCQDSLCGNECASQYGSEWLPRTAPYESCTCVGPDGSIKAPR